MPAAKAKSTGKATASKKVTIKKTATQPATKATKAAKTQPAASTNGTARRTAADVEALVPQFVKHLKAGGTMRELKQEHGFSDDGPIRKALANKGYDSKGNKLDLPAIPKTPKAVAKARQEGHPWYIIALATGQTEAEVKAMAEQAGLDTAGRVYVGGGRGR